MAELDRQNGAKNQLLQITDKLVHANGRFIQILEGPTAAVTALFNRIRSDRRHHSLVTIIDRQTTARAFAELSPFLTHALTDEMLDDGTAFDAAEPLGDEIVMDRTPLQDLMASPTAGPIRESLRVMPQQGRAIDTVDRLLSAVERLVVRRGPDKLSVREVALEANVTSQTAYRYFQHTDDLLRVFVTRRQTIALHRVHDILSHGMFTNERDMAETMIGVLFGALQKRRAVPEAFWQYVLRRHHDFQYDELWSLSEVTLATMRRCGIPCEHITEVEIAAGVMGALSAAKGIALRQSAFFRTRACRTMLIELFLSPLGSAVRYRSNSA